MPQTQFSCGRPWSTEADAQQHSDIVYIVRYHSSIRWNASSACLTSRLRIVLSEIAARFGPVTVNSTCRSRTHNRRVSGAPRSYHLTGNALDFRVRGSYAAVHAFLSRQRTVGAEHYGRGVFHIDTGPRRTWGLRRRYAGR